MTKALIILAASLMMVSCVLAIAGKTGRAAVGVFLLSLLLAIVACMACLIFS